MVNVLIPTDFSANAENAFFYALSLLKRKKCTFYITHILGGSAKYFPYKKPEADDLAKKQIQQLILKAEKNFSDESYVFFSQVLYGNTVDSIRNEVEDKKINLIVIGVKGRAASDNSVGSTTADIIHKVKCSTLIVPEKATFTPGKISLSLPIILFFTEVKFWKPFLFTKNNCIPKYTSYIFPKKMKR